MTRIARSLLKMIKLAKAILPQGVGQLQEAEGDARHLPEM
jgi:hypothetical protein